MYLRISRKTHKYCFRYFLSIILLFFSIYHDIFRQILENPLSQRQKNFFIDFSPKSKLDIIFRNFYDIT